MAHDLLAALKALRSQVDGELLAQMDARIQELTPRPVMYPTTLYSESGSTVIARDAEEQVRLLDQGWRLSPPNAERLKLKKDLAEAERDLEQAQARLESAQATRDRLAAELANITD